MRPVYGVVGDGPRHRNQAGLPDPVRADLYLFVLLGAQSGSRNLT